MYFMSTHFKDINATPTVIVDGRDYVNTTILFQLQSLLNSVPSAEVHPLALPPRPQEGGVEGGVGRRPGDGPGVRRVPPDRLHCEVPAAALGGPGHLHLHNVPVQEAMAEIVLIS